MYIVHWFNFGLWLCNEVEHKEKYIKKLEYIVESICERMGVGGGQNLNPSKY